MKTKIVIDISTDKKNPDNMNVQYVRRDLEQPKNKDEELILKYIEGLVRYTIDNGFAPAQRKEEQDGETTAKSEESVSD